jgi:hypothetical protein
VLSAVNAAVAAARHRAPIPAGLAPPIGHLQDDRYVFPAGCVASTGDVSTKICRLGDSSSSRVIVILGDSHAWMWMPTILGMATQNNWAVIPLIKSGCLPNRWVSTTAEPLAECRTWYRWAIGEAKSLRPDVMMVTGSSNTAQIAAEQGLYDAEVGGIQTVLKSMAAYARRRIVIGDPPALAQEPVDCLLAQSSTMQTCTGSMTDLQSSEYDDIESAARASHAGFIDTIPWFCAQDECPTVIGHTITRADLAHVSVTYALQLIGPFRAAFSGALGTGTSASP